MGKKGSELIPFLREGLETGKYCNQLIYSKPEKDNKVFRLSLPCINSKMNLEKELKIIKDWKARNDDNDEKVKSELETSKDYSVAKQAFLIAVKNSIFLEKDASGKDWIEYRFLSEQESENKRILKKNKTRKSSTDLKAPLSVESGYGSLIDSPAPSHQSTSNELISLSTNEDFSSIDESKEKLNVSNNKLDIVQPSSSEDFEKMWDEAMEYIEKESSVQSDEDFNKKWEEVQEFMESKPGYSEISKKNFPLFQFVDECQFGVTNLLIFKPIGYELIVDVEEDGQVPFKLIPGILADENIVKKLVSGHVSGAEIIFNHLLLRFETCMKDETLQYTELDSVVTNGRLYVGKDHFMFYPFF